MANDHQIVSPMTTTAEIKAVMERSFLTQEEMSSIWNQLENSKEYHIQYNLEPGQASAGYITLGDQLGQLQRLSVATERYFKQGYLAGIQEIESNQYGINFELFDVRKGIVPLLNALQDIDSKLNDTHSENHPQYLKNFLEGGLVFSFKDEDRDRKYYIDPYHFFSIPIGVRTRDGMIGSARIILGSSLLGLPIADKKTDENGKTVYTVPIKEEFLHYIKEVKAEYSQFAIRDHKIEPDYVTRRLIMSSAPALLRASFEISKLTGLTNWLATIDSNVLKLLNGTFYGFYIETIGEAVHYLGSDSTPIFVDIYEAIEGARASADADTSHQRQDRKDRVEFMDGNEVFETVKGENGEDVQVNKFAWYRGK